MKVSSLPETCRRHPREYAPATQGVAMRSAPFHLRGFVTALVLIGCSGTDGGASPASGGAGGSSGTVAGAGGAAAAGASHGGSSGTAAGAGAAGVSHGGSTSVAGAAGMSGQGGAVGTGPDCSATMPTGGTPKTGTDFQGNADGLAYGLWTNGSGGTITVFDNAHAFSANWDNSNNFLANVGLNFGASKKYSDYGKILAEFVETKTGT